MNSNPGSREGIGANGEHREMAQTACVFCNGVLKDPVRARILAEGSDLVVAADGGARHIAMLGLRPDVIIGDMDSLSRATEWGDMMRIRYPSDKDKTDAELAVEYALALGCQQVTLVAAVGGRLDHTLGNVALVARYPGRVAIVNEEYTLVAVNQSERCVLHGSIGGTVSLIPYGSGEVLVRTHGLKYSLQNEPLVFATRGVSNELSETEACICVSGGVMLVCIANQEAPLDPGKETMSE